MKKGSAFLGSGHPFRGLPQYTPIRKLSSSRGIVYLSPFHCLIILSKSASQWCLH